MAVLGAKTFRIASKKQKLFVDVPCESLGGDLRLRRMNWKMASAVRKRWSGIRKDADGQPRSDEDLAEFYVWFLSLSIVDEEGDAYLCSDEGRKELDCVPIMELFHLGDEAMLLNDFGERKDASKKKSGKSGTSTMKSADSSSASVSPPAAST